MKQITCITIACLSLINYAQNNEKLSTIDYVEVLNDYNEEALYYYKNNWEQLRKIAKTMAYIDSYLFLEVQPEEATNYNFILITTYSNKKQYNASETNFRKIIDAASGLKLLNDLKPSEFRRVVSHKSYIKHQNK